MAKRVRVPAIAFSLLLSPTFLFYGYKTLSRGEVDNKSKSPTRRRLTENGNIDGDALNVCLYIETETPQRTPKTLKVCTKKARTLNPYSSHDWIIEAHNQLDSAIHDLQVKLAADISQQIEEDLKSTTSHMQVVPEQRRRLSRFYDDDDDDEYSHCQQQQESSMSEGEEELPMAEVILFVICAAVCTSVAAVIAGLIMGLVSLEPLQLMIKLRVGSDIEKEYAEALLPLVQQHHKLLVTLLLVNCCCNEALPVFLEKIAPGYIAVLTSVTLVLLFGEIIPSAIFTGPNQIPIAASWAPMVATLMWFLSPITYPIVRLLDWSLGHEESCGSCGDTYYDRGEIGAMVRVIYEAQNEPQHHDVTSPMLAAINTLTTTTTRKNNKLHLDEVTMIEGALTMRTKTARDIYKPIKDVYAVRDDIILNEDTVATLYTAGYSRIPVYEAVSSSEEIAKKGIKAIMLSRNLIVVDWDLNRPITSLPLLKPYCVSPDTNLVDLINAFQTVATHFGMAGHLFVVCENPDLANLSLNLNRAIPEKANVLGIVTLEDVFEELLQEDIVDESDRIEAKQMQLARRAIRKWRTFVQTKKKQRRMAHERAAWLAERRMRMRPRGSNEEYPPAVPNNQRQSLPINNQAQQTNLSLQRSRSKDIEMAPQTTQRSRILPNLSGPGEESSDQDGTNYHLMV